MPARKPTALKVLQGTDRKSRAKSEPKPKPLFPYEPPSYFGDDARNHWHKLQRLLEPLGLLAETDLGQFTALCSAFGRGTQADRELSTGTLTVETDGKTAKNPLIQISRDAWEPYSRLSRRFGLDPASRGGLDIKKADADDDPMELLLRSKGQ